jgi:hypothetical protein
LDTVQSDLVAVSLNKPEKGQILLLADPLTAKISTTCNQLIQRSIGALCTVSRIIKTILSHGEMLSMCSVQTAKLCWNRMQEFTDVGAAPSCRPLLLEAHGRFLWLGTYTPQRLSAYIASLHRPKSVNGFAWPFIVCRLRNYWIFADWAQTKHSAWLTQVMTWQLRRSGVSDCGKQPRIHLKS